MTCESCGDKPKKCNKDFTRTVVEIDNPEQITLMRKVTIPASMGDDTTVPPVVGKYKNVLLYYEANSKSYLYSSDGIPTLLANGLTDYEQAINLPQINGVTLVGNKTSGQLDLQPTLSVAPDTGIKLENNELSGLPATDTTIGMVKPGAGLEVASDGTISVDNIAFMFDTVDDMKASTDVKAGDYAKTLGYYAMNDEGGAYYKISSATPSGYYETLTNGLYAELIIGISMNVKQFGAKGDGIDDDTTRIQAALDSSSTVLVPKGTYMIDAITHIKPNSYNKLILDNDANIKAITNSEDSYAIIWCEDVTNVEICGGTLEGERLTHTGATGEWGHCVRLIGNCDEIYIHDINLINAWGDGITCKITGSVYTSRVHVDNVRRNGYSIGAAGRFVSNDDFIENTNGTAPQGGVDIEPDTASNLIKNIVFNNLITKNCASTGFGVQLIHNNATPAEITLNNYISDGDARNMWFEITNSHKANIRINDCVLKNCTGTSAVRIKNESQNANITFDKPIIDSYCLGQTLYSTGISIAFANNGSAYNINIIEPIIINPESTTYVNPIEMNSATGTLYNSSVINPIDLGGYSISFNVNSQNVSIVDGHSILTSDVNESLVLGASIISCLKTTNFTTTRTNRISSAIKLPIGLRIKFINTGNYGLNVYFQNQYIYGITNAVDKTVSTTSAGAYLEIEKIASNAWTVVGMSGTFTAS